jgi:hypothetical protein
VTPPQTVRVGDVTVTIDGADLRDIRWQGHEAIRRIYPVFQDRNWTNRLFTIGGTDLTESDGAIEFTAHGTGSFDAEPLEWTVVARITDQAVSYRFHAHTRAPFWRNRLGMCVLHPMLAAGSAVVVEHTDGQTTNAHLPTQISAHQPFVDMRSITHELPGGGHARVRFAGEVFEMEDHRNWTDASFKTYCTPISLPFPVEVVPGQDIDQEIVVDFDAGSQSSAPASPITDDVVEIRRTGEVTDLPRLGLSWAPDSPPITDADLAALASLGLDHLRVAVSVPDSTGPDSTGPDTAASAHLVEAASIADRIGARLRIASVSGAPEELAAFAELPVDVIGAIDCWYVFSEQDKVTPDDWAPRAREALGERYSDVALGGGTDLYFTELNREPPDPSMFDVLNFSINPQVHAFDTRTLIQNTMTQSVVAANAPRLTRATPVSVSPISLRPRFNPNATEPDLDVSNTPLPSDVDARQMTYVAAHWTAMSIKYLAQAGSIAHATYFEAVGWKGIIESAAGSSDPVNFPSTPDQRFPVWDVFAGLAGMTRAHTAQSSAPEEADALIVDDRAKERALVVNWSEEPRVVRIDDNPPTTIPPTAMVILDLPHTN